MKRDYRRKRVVVIGGGTGLSTMLKGIKKYTHHITAIVTVADNGGGSGKIRQEMGIIPPGDIRNCLVALANTEPIMEKLLQHRFKEGCLEGQNFGNLLLAALTEITGSFEEAITVTSKVLAITGHVLPVTLQDVNLKATFKDNKKVMGETEIVEYGKKSKQPILRMELSPKQVEPTEQAIVALNRADIIILGPGSLYTSIIPNLLVKNISDSIKNSKAEKVYISNIMTQPGETTNISLEEHVLILEKYLGKGIIDKVIVNNKIISSFYMRQYEEEGAVLLGVNREHPLWKRVSRVETSLIKLYEEKKLVRHDSDRLARCIFEEK